MGQESATWNWYVLDDDWVIAYVRLGDQFNAKYTTYECMESIMWITAEEISGALLLSYQNRNQNVELPVLVEPTSKELR